MTFPLVIHESSCCSASSVTLGIVVCLDFRHSIRCSVVSHRCFDVMWLITHDVEHHFISNQTSAYLPWWGILLWFNSVILFLDFFACSSFLYIASLYESYAIDISLFQVCLNPRFGFGLALRPLFNWEYKNFNQFLFSSQKTWKSTLKILHSSS